VRELVSPKLPPGLTTGYIHDTLSAWNGGLENMTETYRITHDPDICGGRPCIRSLRIRVKDILDLLAAGASHSEILEDYPQLEDGDIVAALEYAALQSDHTVVQVA
jgi:uncharacterized protein (DUF433 family)